MGIQRKVKTPTPNSHDASESKHCSVYGYQSDSQILENIVKTVNYTDNPDYYCQNFYTTTKDRKK